MVTEGDWTWGGEHTLQYTDGVLQNCTPETYRNPYNFINQRVSPSNSIKMKEKETD